MTQFFLECTIRAALIVAATAIVLYAMRVRVASVKHRVWTAVLLLMLALPLWIAWGPKAPIRILPANVEKFTADFLVQTPPTNTAQLQKADTWQTTPAAAQPLLSPLEWSFLGLYFFGAFILLARLAIGTLKARCLIRESSSLELFLAEESLALSIAAPTANKEKSRHPEARPRSDPPKVRRGGKDLSWFSTASHSVTAMCHRDRSIRISSRCAAPVTVGCFRPTILLPENWREWSASHLAAVLAHEREHARRRDPLIQWLALFNRAIFWFHPAAWWLEREISALAEECCDAAVLAQGHDPAAYAETLMHMARAVMHSGSRIEIAGNAMPGPRLPQRIRTIIEAAPSVRVSRVRGVCISTSCIAICAFLSAVTLVRGQDATQDWEKAAGGKMGFEVASVKPNTGSDHTSDSNISFFGERFTENGGLFSARNTAISLYVAFAYKLSRVQFQVLNSEMPKWATGARFDIQARAPAGTTKDQMRLMMQALLAERFQLEAHFETRDTPVYLLENVRPGVIGPKLRPHTDSPPCADSSAPGVSNGALVTTRLGFPMRCGSPIGFVNLKGASYSGRNVSMQAIAESFSVAPNNPAIDRPVVDRTGLTGNYDFVVSYWPQANSISLPPDDAPPPLFDAVKQDLGLKLEAAKAPFKKLIIDHMEEPTPN